MKRVKRRVKEDGKKEKFGKNARENRQDMGKDEKITEKKNDFESSVYSLLFVYRKR